MPPAAGHLKRTDEHAGYIAQLQEAVVSINFDLIKLKHDTIDLQKRFHEGGFIYVASPYSDGSMTVMDQRYQQVMWYTVGLLANKQWCYSPIVHCHEMAKMHQLPRDAQYWMSYNFAMLASARELHVYCMDGWNQSVGVAAEIAFWRQHSERSVKFVQP